MPLIDLNRGDYGATGLPEDYRATPLETPVESDGNVLGAAFRIDNTIASAIASESTWVPDDVEEGFSPWELTKGTKYEAHWDRLAQVRSKRKYNAMLADIDREEEDRKTLQAAGIVGVAASMGASVLDWPTLLPGGAFVRGASGGFSALRSAAVTGAAAAGGVAVQEGALHATQQTRTLTESAIGIGAGAVLGGLIGAGGARIMNGAQWRATINKAQQEMADNAPIMADVREAEMAEYIANAPPAGDLGAAVAAADTLEDLSVAGKAAGAAAGALPDLNPTLRGLHSPSAIARRVFQRMIETPIYVKKNLQGRASDQAVETLMKEYTQGAVAEAMDTSKRLFSEARKGNFEGKYDEFRLRVGRAMRRGDADENEYVTKAAQTWREKVFEPLKERAIEVGLLPPDVSIETAISYFSRLYNKRKIEANEGRFRQIVRKWARGNVEETVRKMTKSRDGQIGRIRQEIDDLKLSGEARADLVESLRKEYDSLREANRKFDPLDEQLSDLRRQEFAARKAGDTETAQSIRANVQSIVKAAGDEYADYISRRNLLQMRRRRIQSNIEGRNALIERLRNQIADNEAGNVERLRKLHRSLQILDEKMDRADPALVEEELSKLRTQFAQILERTERAETRLAEAKRKAAETAEADPAKAPDLDAKIDAAEKKFADAEAKRSESLTKLSERMAALEDADPEAVLDELRALVETRLQNAASVIEDAHARTIAALRRIGEADPKKLETHVQRLEQKISGIEARYNERVHTGFDADNNYESYLDEIVDGIYARITGREAALASDYDITVAARGPMKERTFNIPDELIEEFLESDVELVGRRYARVMAADVELKRNFGDVTLKDTIREVQEDYAKLRRSVEADKDLSAKDRAKRLKLLNEREKRDVRDIKAVRDMLRGNYLADQNASGFARTLNAVNLFNYMRAMGGVVLSSLPDIARPMMVHGLGRYMNDGVAPLVTNLKATKLAKREARLAGAVAERILNTRMATLAEVTDPYSMGSPFERFMENSARYFSMANGMVFWNDFMKGFSATMTQNRIIENAVKGLGNLPKKEAEYMAFLGIDETLANDIAKQVAKAAENFPDEAGKMDNVWVAGTEHWDDPVARRAFRAALNKDVDSIIVTKGIGDTPLFARTPLGRTVLQFKSFALATHQRALIRGLQEDKSGFLAGMLGATTVGMFVYFLKQIESNRDISDNPGRWISEGLDRSGMFSIMFEMSNTSEKFGGPGVYGALQSIFPGEQGGKASRYAIRNVTGTLAGPTAGVLEDIVKLYSAANKGQFSESDINAIRRLAPGTTLPLVRSALEYQVMPAARDAVQ